MHPSVVSFAAPRGRVTHLAVSTLPEPRLDVLARLVRDAFPGAPPLDARPMPGGASTRKFFRVELSASRSGVAMFVPEGARTEEIAKDPHHGRWPFLEVRDLLAAHGVRVPEVLGEATDDGWLLLEDLGDDTIANFLLRDPGEKRAIYQRAVRDLARAQAELATMPDGSIVRTRAFDEDLLRWEIDHFREWGLEARGIHLEGDDRATFDGIAQRLAHRIAAWPRGFVHRDYQSRNLMVVDDRAGRGLAWVDFQDALLGPRVYDLVALLSDSYQEFDRAFVEERLDEYASHLGLDRAGREAVGLELDLVTVQRKLKDAGRFVFIDRVKKNPSFLGFVEPTIDKVLGATRRLAAHDDDLRTLHALLGRVLGRS